MNPLSFRIPLRFLRGNYPRLALTVVALACGVALLCAIDLTNRAVLYAFTEVIDTMAGRAGLQVTAGQGGFFPEEVATTVGEVTGVELAVPVVSATAFTADGSGESLTVQGINLTEDAAVRVYEAHGDDGAVLDDPLVFLSQPDSIALTRTFAGRRHLAMGDAIDLETPTGRRRFTVRGLLDPHGVARVYGGNLVVMDIFAAEAAFTRPGLINRVDVVGSRQADLTQLAQAIAATLPAGLHVEAPDQRKADLNKVMQSIQMMLRAVAMLALGAAFLIAFNRVTTVYEARVWQLGVLQATGVPPLAVWWELVKESLLLGAGGVLLGVPIGIGLGRLALPVIATAAALAYNLTSTDVSLGVRPSSLVLGAVLGMGTAVLAAALPAWRATRLALVTTLHSRGVEQPAMIPRSMWVIRALVAAAIAAAIMLQSATRSGMWGLVATALIAIGTALAARPLLQLIGSAVPRGLRWLSGPTAHFTTASLLHNARRTTLTVATLGLGLGVVLWLGMVGRSFEQSVIETSSGAVRSDLLVTSTNIASGFAEAPVDGALVGELRAIPGVLDVAGERMFEWHYAGGSIMINTFDPAYFRHPEFGRWPLYGSRAPDVWEDVAQGEAVIVSSNFVLNLGAQVGDTIVLETPSGPQRLRVAGVTMEFVSARGTLIMSREVYERFWHDGQVSRVFVRVVPGGDVGAVRAGIARSLGTKYSLKILSARDLVEYFATQVRRAFSSVYILAGMVLLVVLVGMADTLAGGVADRLREFGVLRAVGVEDFQLGRMVLAESLMLGLLGVVLAVLAGLGLGLLWVQATFPYLLGWVLVLHLPTWPMVLVAVITLGVSAAAALVPARRAMRVDPAAALRSE